MSKSKTKLVNIIQYSYMGGKWEDVDEFPIEERAEAQRCLMEYRLTLAGDGAYRLVRGRRG